jgi:hypothetical protein
VSLRLLKEDGATLAASKDDEPGEAVIEHAFAADGTYCLIARELSGRFGADVVYRLEVTRGAPGFGLSVDADHVKAPAGGEFPLVVKAARRDYKGEITLKIASDDGDAAFDVSDAVIKRDKTETTMKVKLPAAVKPGQMMRFRVIGRADGDEGTVVAENGAALKRLFPRMLYPPRELNGVIALGVTCTK